MKIIAVAIISILTNCCFAQTKPKGFPLAQSKKFKYKGWTIKKGDTLLLKGNHLSIIQSVDKYRGHGVVKVYGSSGQRYQPIEDIDIDRYIVVYNCDSKNVEYYDLEKGIKNADFILPVELSHK